VDALIEVSMQEKEELTASAQVGQRKFTVLQGRECETIQTGFICLDCLALLCHAVKSQSCSVKAQGLIDFEFDIIRFRLFLLLRERRNVKNKPCLKKIEPNENFSHNMYGSPPIPGHPIPPASHSHNNL